jgi:hypothetical protein
MHEGLTYLFTTLGLANRMPKVSRRRWQANARCNINRARAGLRKLLKDIRAADAELFALAH